MQTIVLSMTNDLNKKQSRWTFFVAHQLQNNAMQAGYDNKLLGGCHRVWVARALSGVAGAACQLRRFNSSLHPEYNLRSPKSPE